MPARPRLLVGLVGSIVMLLSAIPHTLLGWPAQRQVLEQAHVPAQTIRGLQIGWQFGGVAIVTFGLIAAIAFVQVLRGHAPHMRAARLVGLAYTLFGVWAWFLSREPFALVFIVPGLMVLTGATGKG
ncbi:hypothetical protein TBR22_A42390 [Luteitalea sp. TBR-22]|uniref:hypothetical protein n=1 Tax=Luteitalea sp. TBR-22 TaxID=2802971 RepID=UPI001AFB485F|nr:hypothetical protein [Luteitalea sp. TBR-22]BCS35013.1 hypothetical protein TBR22_A42390 [Luteitalea sp. TBR-22]